MAAYSSDVASLSSRCYRLPTVSSNFKMCTMELSTNSKFFLHASCTLADPTPQLASDIVGGKSGQSIPTSRRGPIHICRMACNAYIRVRWYGEGVLFIQLPLKDNYIVHIVALDRPTTSQGSPDESPTADAGSKTHSH